jgi:hypothetical protein
MILINNELTRLQVISIRPVAVAQLLEQLTQDPEFEGLNLAASEEKIVERKSNNSNY